MTQRYIILLVEDSPDDASLFQVAAGKVYPEATLKTLGTVAEAILYLEGKGAFADRTQHPLPAMTFIDLGLPDAPGQELVKWIRKHPKLKMLLVIILTGASDIRQMAQVYLWGADSFILKPADPDELANELGELTQYWIQRGFLNPVLEGFKPRKPKD